MAVALYEGKRKNIQIYKDKDIVNFVFAVFNNDDTDYSFTGIASAAMNIYNDETRTEILATFTQAESHISQSSNDLTLNIDYSADIGTALELGLYWWDLSWVDANALDRVLAFGDCEVI
jgi:hypothetical protein